MAGDAGKDSGRERERAEGVQFNPTAPRAPRISNRAPFCGDEWEVLPSLIKFAVFVRPSPSAVHAGKSFIQRYSPNRARGWKGEDLLSADWQPRHLRREPQQNIANDWMNNAV